ncbi:MAG: hypothetical protein K6G60_03830 [Lachnospiraceae bacterium]|nr:hypothetical protein [Lachnospiraceae bacterium]
MKRLDFFGAILLIVLVDLCLFLNKTPVEVYATTYEKEDNDTAENATYVELGETVEGKMNSPTDEDWFMVYVREEGLFWITISAEVDERYKKAYGDDLYYKGIDISIYDSDLHNVKNSEGGGWYYPFSETESCDYEITGLRSGIYYVCLEAWNIYANTPYKARFYIDNCKQFEAEDNGTRRLANPIKVNELCQGYTSTYLDTDWYSFELEEDGVVKVELKYHEFIEEAKAKVILYDVNGYTELFSWIVDGTQAFEYFSSGEIGLGPGTYYICICPEDGTKWQRGCFHQRMYRLEILNRVSQVWEKEKNNDLFHANDIPQGTYYFGKINEQNDLDYYSYTMPYDADVTVSFEHPLIWDEYEHWIVEVYDPEKNSACQVIVSIDGKQEKTEINLGHLESGKYFIIVSPGTVMSGSDYVISVADDHKHAWEETVLVEPTCSEAGTLYRKCKTCSFVDVKPITKEQHCYGYWNVIKNAGCTTEGLRTRKCTICGEEEEEEIPMAGHFYFEWIYAKRPTCTEDGIQQSFCVKCGELAATRSVPKILHTYGKWVTTERATCYKEGVVVNVCPECGEISESRAIPKIAHTFGEWVCTEEANCIREGKMQQTCTVCGEVNEKATEKTDHTFGDWVCVEEASCIREGKMQQSCTVCGVTNEKTIERKNHVFGASYKVSGSIFAPPIVYEQKCEGCDETVRTEIWDFKWVTPAAAVVSAIFIVGVITVVVVVRKRKRKG